MEQAESDLTVRGVVASQHTPPPVEKSPSPAGWTPDDPFVRTETNF